MLCFYFIEELFGIQGAKYKDGGIEGNVYRIEIELPRKTHRCPVCGEQTDRVHDYRKQRIKAGAVNGYHAEVCYRKRRYECTGCGKRFYEENSFVGRYQRMTKMLILTVMEMVQGVRSFTEVGRMLGISPQTVMRVYDVKEYGKPKHLPRVLGIDEFRGNTGHEKFQVSITDPENRRLKDVVLKRKETYLDKYFLSYPKEERDKVEFFVSDMYKPYLRIARDLFPNAVHIVDKYHWVRQFFWAFESIRKREQKRLCKAHRLYFKHNKKLLMRRYRTLNDDEQQQVLNILYLSADLGTAYHYKEKLQEILDLDDPKEQKRRLVLFADGLKQSQLPELERCAETYYNWLPGILASFEHPFTNAFTEGNHNKIKVLKRNAYGYRDFSRFRKRILDMA